jgi:ABC-type branched-subunit amino acid transport system substrate-binding protein
MNTSLDRRPNSKPVLAASACLVLALGLAACGGGGGGSGPGSQELDLVIGDSLPLSGSLEALGPSGQKASDLAVEEISAAIDDAGADHSVRVVHRDEGEDTDAAVEAARALVHSQHASCLTGPWVADDVVETAQAVAIPNKVLEITPAASSEDITDLSDHDLLVSTALPEKLEGSALAKAISRDLDGAEGHTVNVAASNDSYGDSLTEAFIDSWQGQGGTVGGQVVLAPPPLSSSSPSSSSSGYSTGTTGYSGPSGYSDSSGYSSAYSDQAGQVTSGSPDAIALIEEPDGFAPFASALDSSYGWDPATGWGSDKLVTPDLPDQVGTDVVEGMRAVAPGVPKGEDASEAFVQDFKEGDPHNVALAPFAAQEFDATVLCYLAAVAAGSTDGQQMADNLIDITAPGGDEYTWEQLPDAIEALEDGDDIDYTGASGPIDLDVNGDPTSGVYDIYQYAGGDLKIVGEISVSKPNPATP